MIRPLLTIAVSDSHSTVCGKPVQYMHCKIVNNRYGVLSKQWIIQNDYLLKILLSKILKQGWSYIYLWYSKGVAMVYWLRSWLAEQEVRGFDSQYRRYDFID